LLSLSFVLASAGQDITWRMAGPGGGGWIQSIAFDPHDKDVLYVGCDVGGFYFSSDAGRTYEVRNRGLHDYYIESIAVHPRDSRIIILGTQSGIHRTTDRGLSWQWIRNGFPELNRHRFTAPIGSVCFVRTNVVLAGIGRPRVDKDGAGAIYRSDDTGLNWRRVDGGQLPANAIVSDIKASGNVILVATSAGVFRSDDDGASWKSSSDGLPHRYVEELAVNSQTVYVTLRCTAQNKEPWNGGVFRSDDAGRTWRAVNGEGLLKQVSKRGDPRHLSSNPKEIVVDPRDANVVYVGHRDWVSAGVYKTTDGGQRWVRRSKADMDYGWITKWGPSAQCLALSPAAPDRLAFGTSGHVFLSDDAGKTWHQRYCKQLPDARFTGTGLEVTCAWRVVPDPVRPNRVYFCYMDIGLLISDDNGATFRRSIEGMKMGENCFGVVVDPKQPNTLWAATGWWNHNEGDICRSDDDGKTWRVVGSPQSGLPSGQVLEMAFDGRRLLAAVNEHGIFESRDGGGSWRSILEAKQPTGLLLDPADANHVIVAADRNISGTQDGGKTWQQLNTTNLFSDIKHLAADPRKFSTLYVAARERYDHASRRLYPGGVFRSADGGRTWQRILDDRFVHCITVSPADSRVLYAATTDHPYHDDPVAKGLLKSSDGGATWHTENDGLSLLNIKAIAVNPLNPATLYISTSGNSVFVGHDSKIKP
jgi:photosystem II stability/assembly factor-like uncharacterized protein